MKPSSMKLWPSLRSPGIQYKLRGKLYLSRNMRMATTLNKGYP